MPVSPRHQYYASRVSPLLLGARPTLAEIGGGFGGFAYFLLRDRPECMYLNFDLPEVLLIASYYLLCALPDRRVLLFGEEELNHEVFQKYDIVLLPNFALPELPHRSVDVFVNTGSFSEMDASTIAEYLGQIDRTCTGYLFHENSDRAATDDADQAEVAASAFPIPERFTLMDERPTLWGDNDSRYREYLYAHSHQ